MTLTWNYLLQVEKIKKKKKTERKLIDMTESD